MISSQTTLPMVVFVVSIHKEYVDNTTPKSITARPVLSALNNVEEDEANYISLVVAKLRRGINEMIRASGLLWNSERVGATKGFFTITNLMNASQAFTTRYPFRMRHITSEALMALFEQLQHSNDDLTIYQVEWTFIFKREDLLIGNGVINIPKWVDSKDLISWQNHSYKGVEINCAAFAIAYKILKGFPIEKIYEKAIEIMKRNKWVRDVSFADILNIVYHQFPKYRITILIPHRTKHSEQTMQGPDYVYETTKNGITPTHKCNLKTIYLLYDYENKHYALCEDVLSAIRCEKSSLRFCHRCTSAYYQNRKCECGDDVKTHTILKRSTKKCPDCKSVKCRGQTCTRTCSNCSSQFPLGYDAELGEGHRCIVYKDSEIEKFSTEEDPGPSKKPHYKLWVYDIECSLVRSEEETLEFITDENGFKVNGNQFC